MADNKLGWKGISSIIVIGLVVFALMGVMVTYIVNRDAEWARQEKETCKQIATLAGSNDYRTDPYGNCYFVKDGKLQEVKDN